MHGKYHDRLPGVSQADVADAVRAYLASRGSMAPDELGEALIVADGNFARGHRLSRRGVRHVVDGYLRAANVERPGAKVSNHALRHIGLPLHARLACRARHAWPPGSQDHRPLRASSIARSRIRRCSCLSIVDTTGKARVSGDE